MSKVLKFEQRGWLTAEEMAERDSISLRTVYRRLKRGELESRNTPEGVRYRKPAGDTAAVTDSTDRATKSAQRAAYPLTDSTDTDTLLAATDISAVSTVVEVLVGRLEKVCDERGRMEFELEEALKVADQALDERDELLAELVQWQAFALQTVEIIEGLRD